MELRKSLVRDCAPRFLDVSGPLVDEIDMLLEWGFNGGDDDTILSEIKEEQIQIRRSQFKTLREGEWLQDTVVDFYMSLLQRRGNSSSYKGFRCHFFSAFFYPSLMSFKKNSYNFSSVSSWLDLCPYSLLNMDRIFIPVNVDCVHWALVVVYVAEKQIEYLDSMTYKGKKIMENIARYLDDYAKDNHLNPPHAKKTFEKFCLPNNPRQKDDHSCGVFSLAFADYRALGREFKFSSVDIGSYRKKIAQEILIG